MFKLMIVDDEMLFRIMLPLLKPALATVGLFSIVGHVISSKYFAK